MLNIELVLQPTKGDFYPDSKLLIDPAFSNENSLVGTDGVPTFTTLLIHSSILVESLSETLIFFSALTA